MIPQSELAKSIFSKALVGKNVRELAQGRSDIHRVNPYNLTIKDGWNSRDTASVENQDHIDALALSIAEHGVQEPLTVYGEDGVLIVTDGHCRLLATYKAIETYGAEILTVPVKTELKGAGEPERLLSQIIRNSGKPLAPLESGRVCKRLTDFGWSIEAVAKKTAMSIAKVNSLLELHAAPQAIKDQINSGLVSPTLAASVIRKNGEIGAITILESAVSSAKERGKDKATLKDTGSVSLRKLLKNAFDESEIDDDDDSLVLVKMPLDYWNKIKDELKL